MSTGISWIDVRLGLRMLTRHPALTVVGGLGLAVGTALSVGFFTFVGAHIYPRLPLDEGHRVVALETRDVALNDEERRALFDFQAWRGELQSVHDLAAFRRVTRNVGAGGALETVQVVEMTAAGFRVPRVEPLHGRYLLDDDEAPGAPPVVVIGHSVWQTRYAGASDIIGRDLVLNGVPHAIIGVMPAEFLFPANDRYWTPLRVDRASLTPRGGPAVFIFGRLAPGVSMQQAQAELTTLGTRAAAAYPDTHERLRPMVMPYVHSLSDVQGITLAEVAQMQGMMSVLLLIVAFNVAVLVYARTAARQREIAVRSALGASRRRVVGQLFVEALVLASVAALAGLALARFGIDLGHQIMQAEMETGAPFWIDYGMRPATLLFTIGVALLTAFIVGVLPALKATAGARQPRLHQVGAGGLRLGRTWTLLIIGQVAIAMAALPVTIGMGWLEVERGAGRTIYAGDEFLVAELAAGSDAPDARDADAARAQFGARLEEVMQRLDAEPMVAGVTFRARLPGRERVIRIEGLEPPAESPAGHRIYTEGVASNLASVFGARILHGRDFNAGDGSDAGNAVIVTQAFVRQVLGGGDAVGRRIRHVSAAEARGAEPADVRWYEIVGVVEDMQVNRFNPDHVPPVLLYPVAPAQAQAAALAVRLRGTTPQQFAPRLRQHIVAVDPALRVGEVRSLADRDRQQSAAVRLVGIAVALVLVTVLLLSAAGIYALMSFTVTQRRREIGIRSAIGANPHQVLRSVFSRAGRQVGAGLAAGAALATLFEWLSGGSMTAGRGTIIVPALAAIMALVALLAAWGPARSGLRIEPTEALRADG
jgi:putative ABC transport system permease protein